MSNSLVRIDAVAGRAKTLSYKDLRGRKAT
jgi:hypothetical protein